MMQNSSEALPLVGILLATHNPSEFIAEQIASIKIQENVRIKIYWGDYASTEENKKYVRRLLENFDYSEFDIVDRGPASNFFYLLRQSKEKYIAFADQDDIWLSHKLENQINLLKTSADIPSLVHSNSNLLIGKKLVTRKKMCGDHKFASLAFSNCCQGCTIMINSTARDLILESLPIGIVWHDWWIALVISLRGKMYFSEDVEVIYRIHDGNTIGLPSLFKRINNLRNREPGQISYQIREALGRYKLNNPEDVKEMERILRLTSSRRSERTRAALRDTKRRKTYFEDLLRRVVIIVRQI